MNKKQISLLVVLALAVGLAGGFFLSRLLITQPALADNVIHPGDVKGSSFTMVDDNGRTRAKLQWRSGGPTLMMFDKKGGVIWRAP